MPLIAPSVVQINQTDQPVNPDSLLGGRGRDYAFAEKVHIDANLEAFRPFGALTKPAYQIE